MGSAKCQAGALGSTSLSANEGALAPAAQLRSLASVVEEATALGCAARPQLRTLSTNARAISEFSTSGGVPVRRAVGVFRVQG